jgi:ATP-dependent DNA helicase RecQ
MSDPLERLRAAVSGAAIDTQTALPAEPDFEYAVARLCKARSQSAELGADEAVLLRQAIRWSGQPHLLLGPPPPASGAFARTLIKAGVQWSNDGHVSAEPYSPAWLRDPGWVDARPSRRTKLESIPAEPYLATLGYESWRSRAQKEAAFSVLRTPRGETSIVVLPTGAGKSLCFQLLPRFGSGLTLVVVPTVALAIDQHAAACRRLANLPGVNPTYFSAGVSGDAVVQQVKEKRTRLLFASPEACVSGRLRPLLDKFAKEGWLENVVIDEAHVIWTWGAEFRVEFQILAAVRNRWLADSQAQLRTFLFSATMTPDCRQVLAKMFSDVEPQEFVCQRLRPEIQYAWRSFAGDPDRDPCVIEALWHLPRPLILYATEVREAQRFARLIREQGFRRLECFTGETSSSDRELILQRWKANELDLVVATSAFGLGVDKQDVRSVVHACHPENLDRFYQEVGRGGRDGWSSFSLALPTKRDRYIAEQLASRLMRTEMIQERWSAMFSEGEATGKSGYYALPVNARRTGLAGELTFSENVRWNKRLLVQLNRAGLLEFSDLTLREGKERKEDLEEIATVRVKFMPYTKELGDMMRPVRLEELRQFRAGRIALDHLLSSQGCVSRSLAGLYGVARTQRVCGGCPWCRQNSRDAGVCPPLEFTVSAKQNSENRCDLVESCPSPFELKQRGAFVDLLHKAVVRKRLFQFFCSASAYGRVLECFKQAVPAASQHQYRVDTFDACDRTLSANERPAFLHFSEDDLGALKDAPTGTHFLCGVSSPHDAEGRHIAVRIGHARRWPALEPWLLEKAA